MKFTFNDREELLLKRGIAEYLKNAKAAKNTLGALNVATLNLDVAIGHVEALETALVEGRPISDLHRVAELSAELRLAATDCLNLIKRQGEKVKERQEQLLIDIGPALEWQVEIDSLIRQFAEQTDAFAA